MSPLKEIPSDLLLVVCVFFDKGALQKLFHAQNLLVEEHQGDGHRRVPCVREGEKNTDVHEVEAYERRIAADAVDIALHKRVSFFSGMPTRQLPFIVSMPAMKNPTPSAAMPIPVHCSQQGRVGIPHQMLAISTAGLLIYIIQLEYQGLASLIFLQSVGPSLHYLSRCLLASHHLLVCKPWHICLLMVSDR